MTNLKTTLTPVGHHLVVEPITLPEKSKGGIIISHEGTTWDKLQKASRMLGTVLAVGPQCWSAHAANIANYVLEPGEHQGQSWDPAEGCYVKTADFPALAPWCKVGDLIFYSRHAGKFMFDPIVKKTGDTVEDKPEATEDEQAPSEFGIRRTTQAAYKATLKELYVINDDDVIAVLPPMDTWEVDALDVMTY